MMNQNEGMPYSRQECDRLVLLQKLKYFGHLGGLNLACQPLVLALFRPACLARFELLCMKSSLDGTMDFLLVITSSLRTIAAPSTCACLLDPAVDSVDTVRVTSCLGHWDCT